MIEKVWGQNAGYGLIQVVSKQVKPEGERYLHNLNIALGLVERLNVGDVGLGWVHVHW